MRFTGENTKKIVLFSLIFGLMIMAFSVFVYMKSEKNNPDHYYALHMYDKYVNEYDYEGLDTIYISEKFLYQLPTPKTLDIWTYWFELNLDTCEINYFLSDYTTQDDGIDEIPVSVGTFSEQDKKNLLAILQKNQVLDWKPGIYYEDQSHGLEPAAYQLNSDAEYRKIGEYLNYEFITKKYCQYDKTKHINIEISYPEIKNFPDKKNKEIINDLIKEAALNPYNNISNIDQGIVQGTSWSVDYNIVYVTDSVISIIFEGYLYVQDNANGINWIYSTNIDLISGKKITMSDIFNNTFKDKLNFNYFKSIDTDTKNAEQSALDELFNNHKNDFDNSDDNFYFTKDKFIIILPIDNYYRFASDYSDLLSAMKDDKIIWKSIFAGYGISQYDN